MKKMKLKEQKGFAASDALIAVLIIALFAGLIATISYNIYISNSSIKRMSKATSYIVDMFEYIDRIQYSEVREDALATYFNNKYYYEDDETTPKTNAEVKFVGDIELETDTPFKAKIEISKYMDQEGSLDTEKLDLVQDITMTVTYKLGNKDQVITMTTRKTREKNESINTTINEDVITE